MPELLNPASTKIDPLILQKLQAFADRRRKLIIRRGLYAAVATLLDEEFRRSTRASAGRLSVTRADHDDNSGLM